MQHVPYAGVRSWNPLLLEKIALHGVCRAVGFSLRWLMDFMGARFAAAPEDLQVQLPRRPSEVLLRCVETAADELHSFVQKKANEHWLWLAMDAKSRQIIAFHVGDRSRESAQVLWANISAVYQHHVERFNNILRQRISRLVRESLAFSKQLANHLGAIRFFISHSNLEKAAALPL